MNGRAGQGGLVVIDFKEAFASRYAEILWEDKRHREFAGPKTRNKNDTLRKVAVSKDTYRGLEKDFPSLRCAGKLLTIGAMAQGRVERLACGLVCNLSA